MPLKPWFSPGDRQHEIARIRREYCETAKGIGVLTTIDEPRVRDLFYTLSQDSIYYRFISHMTRMIHANDHVNLGQSSNDIFPTANHFEGNASSDGLVECHGQLRAIAVTLFDVANKIRWLASGPRCAFQEIRLPELQSGSSIMPGKVNPVMCESLMQVAARVLGLDFAAPPMHVSFTAFSMSASVTCR